MKSPYYEVLLPTYIDRLVFPLAGLSKHISDMSTEKRTYGHHLKMFSVANWYMGPYIYTPGFHFDL